MMQEFFHLLWHSLLHTLIDTAKVVPFLFLTYLLMEFLEHKAGGAPERWLRGSGKIRPLVGGALGGGISGAAMITSLALMKRTRSFFLKLLINTGIFLITLLVCGLLGLVFALALSAAM